MLADEYTPKTQGEKGSTHQEVAGKFLISLKTARNVELEHFQGKKCVTFRQYWQVEGFESRRSHFFLSIFFFSFFFSLFFLTETLENRQLFFLENALLKIPGSFQRNKKFSGNSIMSATFFTLSVGGVLVCNTVKKNETKKFSCFFALRLESGIFSNGCNFFMQWIQNF